MNGEPLHVTDAAFEQAVLKAEKPVIVDFWAQWCGPCRMIAPSLERIAKDYADKLIVAKVDTDTDHQWANQYGVQGIPTLLFISGGEVVRRQTGALPEPLLRRQVDDFLSSLGNGNN